MEFLLEETWGGHHLLTKLSPPRMRLWLAALVRGQADEEDAGGGFGEGARGLPLEIGEQGLGGGGLRAGDQEGETAGGGDEAGGGRQDVIEAFDGAEGHKRCGRATEAWNCPTHARRRLEWGTVFDTEVLSAAWEYIDIRQCKRANDFAQEGDFLVLGFDEGGAERGHENVDGDAGEAGAGTEVDEIERG